MVWIWGNHPCSGFSSYYFLGELNEDFSLDFFELWSSSWGIFLDSKWDTSKFFRRLQGEGFVKLFQTHVLFSPASNIVFLFCVVPRSCYKQDRSQTIFWSRIPKLLVNLNFIQILFGVWKLSLLCSVCSWRLSVIPEAVCNLLALTRKLAFVAFVLVPGNKAEQNNFEQPYTDDKARKKNAQKSHFPMSSESKLECVCVSWVLFFEAGRRSLEITCYLIMELWFRGS